ncbi:MAG TPA: sigma-54 dependent transcriptional regulator [Nitrospiraceae bacterium]|jgi:DNA-binding NtrC family response regulator|nr:sigma-54 dependent transcriptional regulator [Nitrospiraceae bacterium]
MKAKILIVDDDPDIVTMLTDRLAALGYDTVAAPDGHRALDMIEQQMPNVVLLDLEMPRVSGLDVLKRLGQSRHNGPDGWDLPVVVMTAYATIARAVQAMKEGACDFVTKPFDVDHLSIVVRKALDRETLKRHVACLRSDVQARYAAIIGDSTKTKSVIELARRAANSDASVLLLGESGTGKELFARSIHQWSPRSSMPFVVINCVALTDTLLENELFGHEKGAFTGADRLQKGKIELADGGTIFLDEIGDMAPTLQAKLLRVLQDHEFQRVGGMRQVQVNIRVIAATNKDLKQAVKAGTFREDLFFRLNVIILTLPALRDRSNDIPALADYFLKRHTREAKKPHMRLSGEAIDALRRYPWPGNIRELENAIARAVVLSTQDDLSPEQLGLSPADGNTPSPKDPPLPYSDLPYHESMEQHSRHIIARALQHANGSQTRAAERLKLQRTYLARLIRQKNISSRQQST